MAPMPAREPTTTPALAPPWGDPPDDKEEEDGDFVAVSAAEVVAGLDLCALVAVEEAVDEKAVVA
jgi:hypothetical protein